VNRLKSWLPFFVSACFYAGLLSAVLFRIYRLIHWSQPYLLDDTYIHLSIAKNLLLHGVYGLSASESAMAASSIVWPFLLVVTGKVFGLSLFLPLVLNIIFALSLLAISSHVLRRNGVRSLISQSLTLMLLVLAFPLIAMTLDGMEHVLYGFSFVLFLWVAGSVVGEGRDCDRLQEGWLIGSAMLLTSCRYEGVFAVFIVCLLLVRRSLKLSVAVGAAGAAPVLLFGIFSRRHGGMWIPNSLVMKTMDHRSFLQKLTMIPETLSHPYTWRIGLAGSLLLIGWLMFLTRRVGVMRTQRSMLVIFLGTALLHIQFARIQTATPRYESYLMGAAVLLGSIMLTQLRHDQRAQDEKLPAYLKALVVLAIIPLVIYRGIYWQVIAPNFVAAVYRQQYQAAQFFSRYYRGQPIVANDVGLVSYYAETECFDLWGLSTNEVAYRVSKGTFTTAVIRQMATQRNVRVGFLYANEFTGAESLPEEWIGVATWTIASARGNTLRPTITFYATTQSDAETLLLNLRDFQKDLPPGVKARMPNGLPLSD
jgi:hypothetical protein